MARRQHSLPLSVRIALRSTSGASKLFQDSHQLISAQCTLRRDRYRLMGCVIHDRQALAQGNLLAPALLYLQTRLGI